MWGDSRRLALSSWTQKRSAGDSLRLWLLDEVCTATSAFFLTDWSATADKQLIQNFDNISP
jgi:hypothetical protein